jgi:hypothetical protein
MSFVPSTHDQQRCSVNRSSGVDSGRSAVSLMKVLHVSIPACTISNMLEPLGSSQGGLCRAQGIDLLTSLAGAVQSPLRGGG